jgi:hypothetical protein
LNLIPYLQYSTANEKYLQYCILGWVDIGIGTKGKWGFVVSLEKVWEIQ